MWASRECTAYAYAINSTDETGRSARFGCGVGASGRKEDLLANSTTPPGALEEWRHHWPLVLTTSIGFSFHSIATYASGLFIEPLEQEFGWSRSQISIGLAIAAIATVPLSPVVGAFIDKWGSRRIALPGLVLTACSLAAFGTVSNSMAHWIALWCAYAFIGLSVKSTVWTHAISSTFNAGRGLALAVMLSGTALAQALVPPSARWLIADVGWREAWFWLGFGWCMPALLLAFFFLKDRPRGEPDGTPGPAPAADDRHGDARRDAVRRDAVRRGGAQRDEGSMTIGQAMRDPALLKLALATFIMMTLGLAVIVHLVPILSERGLTRETAAWVAGLSGIAGIAGKLITGALMDKLDGAKVGAVTLGSAALGFMLMVLPTGDTGTIAGAAIVGYAVGTKLQVTAYLTSHLTGMRSFGKIFGLMNSVTAFSAGLGPFLSGVVYDNSGSYTYLLMAGIPGSIISASLIMSLRRREADHGKSHCRPLDRGRDALADT